MARSLVLRHNGVDIPVNPWKVDRDRLYGFVEREVVDDAGRPCELFTLAADGRTLIARGGTCLAVISAEGEWIEKSRLTAVDLEGRPMSAVPSSYSAPIPVERTATIDEYLAHDIRLIYRIDLETSAPDLLADLRKGTIYSFPYSFRGGIEPDAAFLVCNADGEPFMLVGNPTEFHFVGLAESSGVEEADATETAAEEDDALDFGMM